MPTEMSGTPTEVPGLPPLTDEDWLWAEIMDVLRLSPELAAMGATLEEMNQVARQVTDHLLPLIDRKGGRDARNDG
jgi:hypothetical protein|tara:strand:- start:597 stop:824 length:228 start_codon:yes stop_codon:yes gene_type:complete